VRPAPPPTCRILAATREYVAVSDGSANTTLEALGALLRAQRLASGLSLRDLSARTSVSNAYLSELERGLHEPSLSVLRAIASALDIPLGSLLARAGILDDSPDDRGIAVTDTEAAIVHDPALSEPQRMALLSIYRSFMQTRVRS
jgi:transcriptional regulator with XRE-family HTH domain